MKRYQVALGDQTFDVKVLSDPHQDQVEVEVDGERFTVGIRTVAIAEDNTQKAPMPAPTPSVAAAPAANKITSPLPGVIKSIRVQPGQQVSMDDELVVIEAMKMDNVIRARRAGKIGIIHVTEGRQVAHGEPLLEFEK
jgi:biotin carboxyl carrier protein